MTIKEITASCGLTFGHPFEQFSNIRPSLSITYTVGENEGGIVCAKILQAKVEELVEERKVEILKRLNAQEEERWKKREDDIIKGEIPF